MPFRLYKNGSVLEDGALDREGNAQFEHELEEGAEYEVELANLQRYSIPSSDDQTGRGLESSGAETFENPGGVHE
jgi:type VI secretion system secreted protein VgrG